VVTRDDPVADHEAAQRTLHELFDQPRAQPDTLALAAIGHRVVHGGPNLTGPLWSTTI
jgi:acetate kinase